jgi:hypothetical protein
MTEVWYALRVPLTRRDRAGKPNIKRFSLQRFNQAFWTAILTDASIFCFCQSRVSWQFFRKFVAISIYGSEVAHTLHDQITIIEVIEMVAR